MIKTLMLRNYKGLSGRIDLPPRAVLTGPNGAGKSAVIEALTILTTGYSALGKKPAAIMAAASDTICEITGEDDRGNVLTRRFEKKGATGSASVLLNGAPVGDRAIPDAFLVPCESIHAHEFLALSGDKRAAYLFQNLGGIDDKIDPSQIGPKFSWFTAPTSAGVLLDAFAAKAKALKDERDRCQANLQRLMGQSENIPAGTLQEWREKLEKIEGELEAALKAQAVNNEAVATGKARADQIAHMERQIEQGRQKIEQTERDIGAKCKQRESLGTVGELSQGAEKAAEETVSHIGADIIREEYSLKQRLKQLDQLSAGKCPTCGCSGEALINIKDDLDLAIAQQEIRVEDLKESLTQAKTKWLRLKTENSAYECARVLDNEISVLKSALSSYRSTLAKLENDLDAYRKTTVPVVDQAVVDAKVAGLRTARDEAKKAVSAFTGSQALRGEKMKAEEDRQKLEGELEAIKTATAETKVLRDKVLGGASDKVKGPFQEAVMAAFRCDAYLEILDEKNKPTVDFGIIRDGRRIGLDTLSGGERVAVLVALVSSLQNARCGHSRLALVEMAEADRDRTDAVMKVVDALGFEQAVLASCHADISRADLNWRAIDMAAWRAA